MSKNSPGKCYQDKKERLQKKKKKKNLWKISKKIRLSKEEKEKKQKYD